MMIKHLGLIATLCTLGLASTPRSAAAAPIVLNLDCVLRFDPCQPSAIYGTITLTQVGAGVSVTVDLPGTRGRSGGVQLRARLREGSDPGHGHRGHEGCRRGKIGRAHV